MFKFIVAVYVIFFAGEYDILKASAEVVETHLLIPEICEFKDGADYGGGLDEVNAVGSGGGLADIYKLDLLIKLRCNQPGMQLKLTDTNSAPEGDDLLPVVSSLEGADPSLSASLCEEVTKEYPLIDNDRPVVPHHSDISQEMALSLCVKLTASLTAGKYVRSYTLTITEEEE